MLWETIDRYLLTNWEALQKPNCFDGFRFGASWAFEVLVDTVGCNRLGGRVVVGWVLETVMYHA